MNAIEKQTLSPWVRELFMTIDRMDAKAFTTFFSEGGVFKFANAPEVVGKAEIEKAVAGFFSSIQGLRHELVREWRGENSVVVEGSVTYTRKDQSQLRVPFVDVFNMKEHKIDEYRIYIDISTLYS